jgi:hypothetical protein
VTKKVIGASVSVCANAAVDANAIVTVAVIVVATQLAAIFSTLSLYRMKVVEALVEEE